MIQGNYLNWALIISPSLVHSILGESHHFNLFKATMESFCQIYEGITIILKVRNQNEMNLVSQEFEKQKFSFFNYIIFSKNKYSERISAYDLQEVNKHQL